MEITGVVTGPVFDMCSSSDNLNCFAAVFSPGQLCRGEAGRGREGGRQGGMAVLVRLPRDTRS